MSSATSRDPSIDARPMHGVTRAWRGEPRVAQRHEYTATAPRCIHVARPVLHVCWCGMEARCHANHCMERPDRRMMERMRLTGPMGMMGAMGPMGPIGATGTSRALRAVAVAVVTGAVAAAGCGTPPNSRPSPTPSAQASAELHGLASSKTSESCADPVIVIEAGREHGAVCPADAEAASSRSSISAMRGRRALFAPSPTAARRAFARRYLALAAEHDADGKPLAGEDALGELYGVLPSLAIVRERLADDRAPRLPRRSSTRAPIALLDKPYAQDHKDAGRSSTTRRARCSSSAARARARRGASSPDLAAFAAIPALARAYARWNKLDRLSTPASSPPRSTTCARASSPSDDADGSMTWRTGERDRAVPAPQLPDAERAARSRDPRGARARQPRARLPARAPRPARARRRRDRPHRGRHRRRRAPADPRPHARSREHARGARRREAAARRRARSRRRGHRGRGAPARLARPRRDPRVPRAPSRRACASRSRCRRRPRTTRRTWTLSRRDRSRRRLVRRGPDPAHDRAPPDARALRRRPAATKRAADALADDDRRLGRSAHRRRRRWSRSGRSPTSARACGAICTRRRPGCRRRRRPIAIS